MKSEALVTWEIADGVGHIVMNRPDAANALDTATSRDLVEAVGRAVLAAGKEVGAVLLSARGRHFCAGGDINEFVVRRDDLEQLVRELLDGLHPAIHALATLPVPVVSAVQGPIGGAGISLALCADLVLAAPAMKLRGGYSALGLSPDLGASYYLSRRAGSARAKAILMTNRTLSCDECQAWGLVDEVHGADQLPAAATDLARRLAQGSTRSLGGIKALCDGAFAHDLQAHLALEAAALMRCAASADGREGVSAFVEKRAPVFDRLMNLQGAHGEQ